MAPLATNPLQCGHGRVSSTSGSGMPTSEPVQIRLSLRLSLLTYVTTTVVPIGAQSHTNWAASKGKLTHP